jgi:predicted house-cleaning noncanonical NTP pyrophosphatase (MazG superfamily)
MPKLVRDKIPEIIAAKWQTAHVYTANNEEYWERLKDKLIEEAHEVIEEKNIPEELADLIEVIHAICSIRWISLINVEKIRTEKKEKRGGFEEKIILDDNK